MHYNIKPLFLFMVDVLMFFTFLFFFDTVLLFSMQVVLFEKPQFSGQAYEIYRDMPDATSLQLSPFISVKVVRGW